MDPSHLFSSEEEEILIGHVKNYPCLYNYKSKDYKDSATKFSAWAAISDLLGKPEDVCKTKWKNIRDWYIRKKRDRKLPSGSGTVASLMRARFKRLSFLDGCDETRQSSCNGSEGDDDDEDTHPFQDGHFISASLKEPQIVIQEGPKHEIPEDVYDEHDKLTRKHADLTAAEVLLVEHVSNSTATLGLLKELVKNTKNDQGDHLDSFFKGIAATVRNLPLAYQTVAKRQIVDLVLQLESDALENPDNCYGKPAKRMKKEQ